MSRRPLVGVICCMRNPEDPVQGVAERNLRAAPFVGADFVLVPSMPDIFSASSILSRLDGVLLTGSPSNVAPSLYRSADAGDGPFDPGRDGMAFQLISESVEQDRPVLGICRGFQEIAVAYGATLRRDLAKPNGRKFTTPRPAFRWKICLLSSIASIWLRWHFGARDGGAVNRRQLGAFSGRRRCWRQAYH